jgi:hypothetical protein
MATHRLELGMDQSPLNTGSRRYKDGMV